MHFYSKQPTSTRLHVYEGFKRSNCCCAVKVFFFYVQLVALKGIIWIQNNANDRTAKWYRKIRVQVNSKKKNLPYEKFCTFIELRIIELLAKAKSMFNCVVLLLVILMRNKYWHRRITYQIYIYFFSYDWCATVVGVKFV